MLSWFTEDSTLPMVSGVIMVMIVMGLAISAREKMMVYLAIAIAALTVGTVICERLIVTEQEEVVALVYDLASAVQANDNATVLGFVSHLRQDTIDRINSEMPRYDFSSCRVIGTNYFAAGDEEGARTAEICFVVTFRVRLDGGEAPIPGHRKVILYLEKQPDGKFRVINYSHEDPRKGISI
jgi:hypothetical protein